MARVSLQCTQMESQWWTQATPCLTYVAKLVWGLEVMIDEEVCGSQQIMNVMFSDSGFVYFQAPGYGNRVFRARRNPGI